MHRSDRLVRTLRILLGIALAALVAAQVLALPAMSGRWAEEAPELAYLRWPMLAVSVLGLVCVQVVIACTWRLLTMVEDDRIFSDASLLWVDTILVSMAVAWVLMLGTFAYVVGLWGLTALPVALLLGLVAGAVLGLLMVVMRALLRQATSLRTDLEAVI